MKVVFSLFLALASMFISSQALAVSLEFKFDVNSSGPSIYPCNAGIKHDQHAQRACYDRVTQQSCDPANCISEAQCNCVCTGGAAQAGGDGEYRMDYLRSSYAAWSENGEYAPTSVQNVTVSANQGTFAEVFTGKLEWDKQLTALSFNLGTERYGAEFFLDVCYRGPQIEYFQAYQNISNSNANFFPNFAIKAQATVTDFNSGNGLLYSQLAELKVKAQATCDVQGEGTYIYAHSGSASAPIYDNAIAHDITGITGGTKNFITPYSSFNSGANVFLINDWINLGNAKTPRFCKVRYTFIENVRNNSDLLKQIRKWRHHKAQICTFTDITEPN